MGVRISSVAPSGKEIAMEWHLDGPNGPIVVRASTPDEAVIRYGILCQLEDYELAEVEVLEVRAIA